MRTLLIMTVVIGAVAFVDGFVNDFRISREVSYEIRQFGHEAEALATRILRGFHRQ